MGRPFLLLTGDDSVRSLGLILVKRMVQDFAEFEIVATKHQQSATGSKLTFPGSIWGTEVVDGKKAYWVDGTPSDAAYFAFSYFDRKPDLVISGVNMGPNVTTDIHRSGTVAAAMTAVQSRFTQAVAFSMVTPPELWQFNHDGSFDEKLLEYPGKAVRKIIDQALQFTFAEQTFWNVNFPEQVTEKIAITNASQQRLWLNNMTVKGQHFKYIPDQAKEREDGSDVAALDQNQISITPCKVEFTDFNQLDKLKQLFRNSL